MFGWGSRKLGAPVHGPLTPDSYSTGAQNYTAVTRRCCVSVSGRTDSVRSTAALSARLSHVYHYHAHSRLANHHRPTD